MPPNITAEEVSKVIERKLDEHLEKTFRNGRAPKMGLDMKALLSIAGMVITILMIVVGLMTFAFQTRIQAAEELSTINQDAAVAETKADALDKRVVKTEKVSRLSLLSRMTVTLWVKNKKLKHRSNDSNK